MIKIALALVTFLSLSLTALAGVNINTASQAELESLNGIGPTKAQAIIEYRKKNGAFKTVDELEKVEGVGPVTLQSVRKDIAVSGSTSIPKEATIKGTQVKDGKAKRESSKATPAAPTKSVKVEEKVKPK